MAPSKQLLVGLPSSGKTTFIAALWHVVDTGEVPSSLRVSHVTGVRDHLNRIREQWVNCQALDRTKISAEKLVSFCLEDPASRNETEVFIPDLSGETFQQQWEARHWTAEFQTLAEQSQGVLLFIHPKFVKEPVRLNPALEAMVDAAMPADAPETETVSDQDEVPWSPDKAPTQVQLVEIVQFLLDGPFSGREMRLGVIISAWDIVTEPAQPDEWLRRRLPLLDQFLVSNQESLAFRVYGVSAQGGELREAEKLQAHVCASDRIEVAGPKAQAHDITAPLRWIMGL